MYADYTLDCMIPDFSILGFNSKTGIYRPIVGLNAVPLPLEMSENAISLTDVRQQSLKPVQVCLSCWKLLDLGYKGLRFGYGRKTPGNQRLRWEKSAL